MSDRQLVTKKVVVLAAMLLCGCAKPPEQVVIDETKGVQRGLLRHEYFVECMKLLPAGPQTTHYSDWDEVVDSCSNQAWYQANQVIP